MSQQSVLSKLSLVIPAALTPTAGRISMAINSWASKSQRQEAYDFHSERSLSWQIN